MVLLILFIILTIPLKITAKSENKDTFINKESNKYFLNRKENYNRNPYKGNKRLNQEPYRLRKNKENEEIKFGLETNISGIYSKTGFMAIPIVLFFEYKYNLICGFNTKIDYRYIFYLTKKIDLGKIQTLYLIPNFTFYRGKKLKFMSGIGFYTGYTFTKEKVKYPTDYGLYLIFSNETHYGFIFGTSIKGGLLKIKQENGYLVSIDLVFGYNIAKLLLNNTYPYK